MAQANLSPPRRTRLGVATAVVVLHVLAVLALIRAFAPEFSAGVAQQVTSAFTVTVTTPPPSPAPAATAKAADPAGAAAEAGRKATPREAASPEPKIVLASPTAAPPVAGSDQAVSAGARDTGIGTGGGGQGSGTGAGTGGSGQGGGGAARPVKIAGDINSARDYPAKSRELRLGDQVIVALTVGIDGRVKACRIVRASRDPDADRITCRLATDRFRFRPASNAAGEPIESVFGWQQRWFAPEAGRKSEKD